MTPIQLRLFISNNDDTVKVYSLASGTLVTLVRCPVAINYCSLSPSGRYLACVGDNRHTYLYESTPTGLSDGGGCQFKEQGHVPHRVLVIWCLMPAIPAVFQLSALFLVRNGVSPRCIRRSLVSAAHA